MSTPKARKIRARKMCGLFSKHGTLIEVRGSPEDKSYVAYQAGDRESPVLVLDGSREGYEAMVEQGARALTYTSAIEAGERHAYAMAAMKDNWRNGIPDMKSALASIGITAPTPPSRAHKGKE